MRVEDKDICKSCGGFCCKKSGCDYIPTDFNDLGTKALIEILNEGNVSVVGAINIVSLPNGKKACAPFLYLRARNVNRGPIDIFSFKKQCSMLTDTGCTYDLEHRPTGGANLVPVGLDPKTKLPLCRNDESPLDLLLKWEPYQNTLRKVVKRVSGMTVEQCFLKDLEEVLYDILMENFKGVSEIEIADMLSCITDLVRIYPEIYERARQRASKNITFLAKRYNRK